MNGRHTQNKSETEHGATHKFFCLVHILYACKVCKIYQVNAPITKKQQMNKTKMKWKNVRRMKRNDEQHNNSNENNGFYSL